VPENMCDSAALLYIPRKSSRPGNRTQSLTYLLSYLSLVVSMHWST